jgi:uncharacterized cupin superfamily protein
VLCCRRRQRCTSTTLDPGEYLPYHSEYVEEWLLVVDGTIVARIPDGDYELHRGDLVRYPAGPEGAHQIANRSGTPARVLLFSRAAVPAISVYPDTDTIGVVGAGTRHVRSGDR